MQQRHIRTETLEEQPTAVVTGDLTVADIPEWLDKAYHVVVDVCRAQGRKLAGPPFARYHRHARERFVVQAGFPVAEPIEGAGDVQASSLPAGPVAIAVHVGPYEEMEPTYDALASWVRRNGGEPTGDAWEVYLSDPREQPDPATWRTAIVQPYQQRSAAWW